MDCRYTLKTNNDPSTFIGASSILTDSEESTAATLQSSAQSHSDRFLNGRWGQITPRGSRSAGRLVRSRMIGQVSVKKPAWTDGYIPPKPSWAWRR